MLWLVFSSGKLTDGSDPAEGPPFELSIMSPEEFLALKTKDMSISFMLIGKPLDPP